MTCTTSSPSPAGATPPSAPPKKENTIDPPDAPGRTPARPRVRFVDSPRVLTSQGLGENTQSVPATRIRASSTSLVSGIKFSSPRSNISRPPVPHPRPQCNPWFRFLSDASKEHRTTELLAAVSVSVSPDSPASSPWAPFARGFRIEKSHSNIVNNAALSLWQFCVTIATSTFESCRCTHAMSDHLIHN